LGQGREYPPRPLVGVGALIHSEGKVLLIKRKFEPNKSKWSLPGGALETGESLEDGCKREVREELGLNVRIREIFQVSEEIIPDERGKTKFHFVLIDFLASPVGTRVVLNEESEEFRWVTPVEGMRLDATGNTRLILKKFKEALGEKGSR
jgi:8-oxo-dGTP diphosphatase